MSAGQTITASTWTVLAIDTVDVDTQGGFDTSTHQYTPNVSGLYLFVAGVNPNPSGAALCGGAITKNGIVNVGTTLSENVGNTLNSPVLVALVQMNGTTDYIEVCVYSNGNPVATNPSLTGILLA